MRRIAVGVCIILLLYTRYVNIGWGLPYVMHPDERNMAVAVQQLSCNFKFQITNFKFEGLSECLNPRFYAYGQFPLYLAYAGIQIFHGVRGISLPISYDEATTALRIISVLSSVGIFFVSLRLFRKIVSKKSTDLVFAALFLIFQPYLIQFAHFGTTESLLMCIYLAIVYVSVELLTTLRIRTTVFLALVSGAALATKTSSVLFLIAPFLIIASHLRSRQVRAVLKTGGIYAFLTTLFFVILSPQSIVHWSEFISSMNYESAVGLGAYRAFYTRQFEHTTPLLFQLWSVLPFVFGVPIFLLSLIGFLFVDWKNKKLLLLRIAVLAVFLPSSFFYAKWTRFIAPVFPIMSLFAYISLQKGILRLPRPLSVFVLLICIIPGIAYLSIYQSQDVRFTASQWIYRNIPDRSKILSETANVLDIPVPPPGYIKPMPNYYTASFNFYNLDTSPQLQSSLQSALSQADYILVPSRRIFKNHPASQFPKTAEYYQDLFSGKSGFTQIGEITSFPKLVLFGQTVWEWNDEDAEETWTVFDHPVIRIYKKITHDTSTSRTSQIQNSNYKIDLTQYEIVEYMLHDIRYTLLVADTPEKWEKGLMFIKNKSDIRGYDGMIFRFPDSAPRTFWNKNTVSSLQLYWIDRNEVIGISYLPSLSQTSTITTVSSPASADTVIELLP